MNVSLSILLGRSSAYKRYTPPSGGGGGGGGNTETDTSPDGRGTGNTYYVDASVANDSGDGSAGSPKKHLQSGLNLMTSAGGGGHTLIVKPGTYGNTLDQITGAHGNGTAAHWNTVKAETDGTVFISAIFLIGLGDHYLRFEGLNLTHTAVTKGITGRYVKMIRCSSRGGPAGGTGTSADNAMNFSIGTSDATPGAQYILLEDFWCYDVGGRYSVLVYNADKVILRRVLVRKQAGWSDTKGDPQACIALYNSTDVWTQHCIAIDLPSLTGLNNYEAQLYHPSNEHPSSNITDYGFMSVNCAGAGVGYDDSATTPGMVLSHAMLVDTAMPVFVNGGNKTVSVNNLTAIGSTGAGPRNYSSNGATLTISDSVLTNMANASNTGGVTLSTGSLQNNSYPTALSGQTNLNPATSGSTWPTRIEVGSAFATAGQGANLLKRMGAAGTLFGDTGYDQLQNVNLWPWPNEDRIKAELGAQNAIGFCTGNSLDGTTQKLSKYIWEKTGTQIPAGIYA
jgi:hypothetical protein